MTLLEIPIITLALSIYITWVECGKYRSMSSQKTRMDRKEREREGRLGAWRDLGGKRDRGDERGRMKEI